MQLFSFLSIAILTVITLPINSCCFAIACDPIPPSINIRLMRDGKNAVFGPDAFIPVDSIRVYEIIDSSLIDISFTEYTTDGILQFQIVDERAYLLEISGIISDTITARVEEADDGGCCKGTHVFDVRRNGVVVCEEDCGEEVLEINI